MKYYILMLSAILIVMPSYQSIQAAEEPQPKEYKRDLTDLDKNKIMDRVRPIYKLWVDNPELQKVPDPYRTMADAITDRLIRILHPERRDIRDQTIEALKEAIEAIIRRLQQQASTNFEFEMAPEVTVSMSGKDLSDYFMGELESIQNYWKSTKRTEEAPSIGDAHTASEPEPEEYSRSLTDLDRQKIVDRVRPIKQFWAGNYEKIWEQPSAITPGFVTEKLKTILDPELTTIGDTTISGLSGAIAGIWDRLHELQDVTFEFEMAPGLTVPISGKELREYLIDAKQSINKHWAETKK